MEPNTPPSHRPLHAAVVSPREPPYFPASHGVHVADPDDEYWPRGHCTAVALTEPAGQAYPAGHSPLQLGAVRPVDEPYAPPGHKPLQLAFVSPALDPYRPAAQGVHVAALPTEYWPAGHSTAVALVEPAGHAYPAAHGPLHVGTDIPLAAPYRPASHGPLHRDDGSASVPPYCPGGQ